MLIGLACDAKSPLSVQAEALGPAALPVAALAAFVTAAGINWSTSASADQVPGLISRLWGEYNDATGAGDLETIATGHLSVSSLGRIIVGPTLVAAWQKFVSWLQSDKSVAAGETISVYPGGTRIGDYILGTDIPDSGVWLSPVLFAYGRRDYDSYNRATHRFFLDLSGHGTILQAVYTNSISGIDDGFWQQLRLYPCRHGGGGSCDRAGDHFDLYHKSNGAADTNWAGASNWIWDGYLDYTNPLYQITVDTSAGLDLVGASAIDVPGQGMADTDSVALDVGATAGATADDIAAAVAAGIAAGTFTASATVEAVEPIPGGNEDIDGLGLPSLGALLTTRFPFSIPWDVKAVFGLLSADAQAPYWEVDLMAPLKGKGQKFAGDTKIKIDLTGDRWAVIGQVSRWGSLVGFCIALAYATKRLIWTA